jgi:hypothetical protein
VQRARSVLGSSRVWVVTCLGRHVFGWSRVWVVTCLARMGERTLGKQHEARGGARARHVPEQTREGTERHFAQRRAAHRRSVRALTPSPQRHERSGGGTRRRAAMRGVVWRGVACAARRGPCLSGVVWPVGGLWCRVRARARWRRGWCASEACEGMSVRAEGELRDGHCELKSVDQLGRRAVPPAAGTVQQTHTHSAVHTHSAHAVSEKSAHMQRRGRGWCEPWLAAERAWMV